jgi:predicted nuclease of restriction endonuclease-like (RecB) superfamily
LYKKPQLERSFYEQQAIRERWSVPELKRQKSSALFLRLAASKDRAEIIKLAQQGLEVFCQGGKH